MTKITVFLEGTKVTELELDAGREYLLGRATACDIVLAHPKISRQHAKLSFDGQDWRCTILSKFGNVSVSGQPINGDFTLTNGSRFSIPPYEVKFEQDAPQTAGGRPVEVQSPADFSEKTKTGIVSLRAVLFRLDARGNTAEEIDLGIDPLTAGRSKSCGLHLNAPEASRRHFSIEMRGRDFVVSDLGSANKTYVNGKETQSHVLQSGDEISVGNEKFRFELINPEFENVPSNVPDVGPADPMAYPVPLAPANQPAVIKITPGAPMAHSGAGSAPVPRGRRPLDKKLIKIAGLAVLGIVIVFQLTGKKDGSGGKLTSGSTEGGPAKAPDSSGYDRLTPEQKKSIDETYNLAMTLYTTGKYDLAAIEINKILQLVNNYKDARNIQALCQQALEIKRQQDDAQRIKNEQEALKQKVSDILDHCEALLKEKRFDEVEPCTGQIADLDPDNQRAANLVLTAKQYQEQIEANREQKAEMERRKHHAFEVFARAQKDFQAKRYLASVKEFENVENTAFVDTDGLKQKARSALRSAKGELQKQSDSLVAEGKTALDSKDFGTAYQKFTEALHIYPGNGDAREYRDRTARELHEQVKNMYDESVIEENLGNIESAKKKWHIIMKEDVKSDDYFHKAKDKLGKYEK